jgi:two-component system phosphate regulon sensor histidine kinase PhoR
LALARLESEPSLREPYPVSVKDVLRVCYERHLQTAERKGLSLSLFDIPAGLRVLAEEEALEHILDNLVDNALKYTEPGGTVMLQTRQDGDAAYLEVKDTGIGIPQQHLPRIFERFYRVDRHRSREVGGTGLGLSIVKHLVQSIGGSINVNSKLHEGSTFSVRFRLAQPEIE